MSLASLPLTIVATNNASQDLGYDPNVKHFDCGVSIHNASTHLLATHSVLKDQRHHNWTGSHAGKASHHVTKRNAPIIVSTYFHIVTATDDTSKALITDSMPADQLTTLNTAYKPAGFEFRLVGTTYNANDSWATGTDPSLQATLRQGEYGVLNIYFLTNMTGSILGQCSMPTNVGSAPAPPQIAPDGCIISAATMPGAPAGFALEGYDLGMTLVHEVGHWLGLFHPFEGNSCDASLPGDYIADTPVQSTATQGCPTGKDSCPSDPGLDSVNNYMDYSTDACYSSFTADQMDRMQSLWGTYREPFMNLQ
jgi:hypothetical protein